jgi:hypothetical protein
VSRVSSGFVTAKVWEAPQEWLILLGKTTLAISFAHFVQLQAIYFGPIEPSPALTSLQASPRRDYFPNHQHHSRVSRLHDTTRSPTVTLAILRTYSVDAGDAAEIQHRTIAIDSDGPISPRRQYIIPFIRICRIVVALDNADGYTYSWGTMWWLHSCKEQGIWALVACVAQIVHCSWVSHYSLGIRRDGW